jgi:hypothetical protein
MGSLFSLRAAPDGLQHVLPDNLLSVSSRVSVKYPSVPVYGYRQAVHGVTLRGTGGTTVYHNHQLIDITKVQHPKNGMSAFVFPVCFLSLFILIFFLVSMVICLKFSNFTENK